MGTQDTPDISGNSFSIGEDFGLKLKNEVQLNKPKSKSLECIDTLNRCNIFEGMYENSPKSVIISFLNKNPVSSKHSLIAQSIGASFSFRSPFGISIRPLPIVTKPNSISSRSFTITIPQLFFILY